MSVLAQTGGGAEERDVRVVPEDLETGQMGDDDVIVVLGTCEQLCERCSRGNRKEARVTALTSKYPGLGR